MTWSYIVWGAWFAAFVVLELLGVFGVAPWRSLSRTVWELQNIPGVSIVILAGLAVLVAHIVNFKKVTEGDGVRK